MKQQTGSKLRKEYVKAVIATLFTYLCMQGISWDMLDWMKHKLESRLQGEISITSDMQMRHHPYGRKRKRTKEPLDESEKVGLKLNIQKTKTMASGPITS